MNDECKKYLCIGVMWLLISLGIGGCNYLSGDTFKTPLFKTDAEFPKIINPSTGEPYPVTYPKP
jgi:hypothetical protein